MPMSALMDVMVAAAREAGRSLVRDFDEVGRLPVSLKGPADFVSAADHRAEEVIFRELSRGRPGYGFLMEERGAVAGTDGAHRWIVDPLDGTTNFLHGVPVFAISIGLEREGRLVAGLVYNPSMDEMFTAETGRGAFLNDRPLRVTGRQALADALVSTGIPHRGRSHHGLFLDEARLLLPEIAGLRRTGSASLDLAWTAAGRFDGYWEHGLGPWDVAAGIVLVREAGGIATDLEGGGDMLETGDVLVGNPAIHERLLTLLSVARAAP
jgi:myo-inositol-1(or 4)-monophosphatase